MQNAAPGTSRKVLFVDDDAQIRRAVERMLRRHKFIPLIAQSVLEGLDLAKQERPQLAVIDRVMPEADGLDLVRQLKKELGRGLHATVLSGDSDRTSRLEAFRAGADDFVAKPVDLDELHQRLEAALRLSRALEQAESARERLEQLLLYSGEATALLAHDLNNGFCIALSNLDYVLSNANELSDTADRGDEACDALRSATLVLQRMSALTCNFVDISRMEDGVLLPRKHAVHVSQLIRGTCQLYEYGIRARDSQLDLDIEDDMIGHCDPALVERVIHNLLGNATRYVGTRGIVRVDASTSCAGRVQIAISNTGPKIPPCDRATIFDKYKVGEETRAKSGMGLYFCRLVCEAHSGWISLDEGWADGARFILELPLDLDLDVEDDWLTIQRQRSLPG